jgi:hypothetical protein
MVATRPEHIAGVWYRNWSAYGGTLRFDVDLTFRADSTFSMDGKDGMHIFAGRLLFDDGKVTMDSDECYDEVKGLFYHCSMTFTVYSTLRDGRPVHIRMVSDGGKGVFYKNFDNKVLSLDNP